MSSLSINLKTFIVVLLGFVFLTLAATSDLLAKTERPNKLVILGDDIGMWNVGAYTDGMLSGFRGGEDDRWSTCTL